MTDKLSRLLKSDYSKQKDTKTISLHIIVMRIDLELCVSGEDKQLFCDAVKTQRCGKVWRVFVVC